jgi:GNAT superfamily N-acetyltransferase
MIRRAEMMDAEAIAQVFRLARKTCLPYLPDLHTPQSELAFFRDHVLRHREVWVAGASSVDGFCAFGDDWVEHLYVRPDCHRRGLGTALLNQAKQDAASLQLWVFQRNAAAIRFYLHHGFQVVQATDGSGNEEHEPDFRMRWHAEAGRRGAGQASPDAAGSGA